MEKKVILYTFPPVPEAYNISPFGIKVESFLRLHKTPYEVVYTSKFGPKGKIPYIELVNDEKSDDSTNQREVIPDSNVIMDRLEQAFATASASSSSLQPPLSDEQAAIAHLITRMLDEHTAQIGFYYRYCLETDTFMARCDMANRFFHADSSRMGAIVAPLFAKGIRKGFGKKFEARGLAAHSLEELWKFAEQDLRTLERLLGDKPFFGGDKAQRVDCVVFGHLAQFLYLPLDFPQKAFLHRHCPNLIAFMERFRKLYWPDWEEKCQRKPNQNMLERMEKAQEKSRRMTKSLARLSVASVIVAGAVFLAQQWRRSTSK